MDKNEVCPLRPAQSRSAERGNILFIILIAIVLVGALTAAISGTSDDAGSDIGEEELSIRLSEVQRYMGELERGIGYIQQNSGISEEDIRFMNPDPAVTTYGDISADSNMQRQMFHVDGGAANYREPPTGIQNSALNWEFYGGSNMPAVGTDRADLIAVLPDVTLQFCTEINRINGQTNQIPADTGACLYTGATDRFGTITSGTPVTQFAASPNDLMDDIATFTNTPAMQACVECDDGSYHFYHVLMAR